MNDLFDPPRDLQAEKVVLGAMLLNPNAIEQGTARLGAADWFDGKHQRLFELIVAEYQAGRSTSAPAILGRLVDTGLIQTIDGNHLHQLINSVPVVANVDHFTNRVRQMGLRRRLLSTALRVAQMAADERDRSAESCLEAARIELDKVEAASVHDEDGPTPITAFLHTQVEHDWLLPGLVERGERLLLTGPESFGKSTLLRQLSVCAAAGVDPFDWTQVEPRRVLVVDCENPVRLNQRRYLPLVTEARKRGWSADNLWMQCRPEGLDLTAPDDAAWLVRQVRAVAPDLLAIGPIYKIHNGDPNDEQVARKITKVIDYLRGRFGIAVLMEAHSPHGDGIRPRPVRPFGASLWRRWPDFGLGIRGVPKTNPKRRVAEVVQWKARDTRAWPAGLRAGTAMPWVGVSEEQLELEKDGETI